MIRLLAALVATIGFLSMAAAGHATGCAMESGLVAQDQTLAVRIGHCQACAGGSRCRPVCANCILVLPGQVDTAVPVQSKTKGGPVNLITFNLSWALYRPPKSGSTPNDGTVEDQLNLKGTQHA
ncbi:MAG: hypothetical protein H7317_10875 [Pseudorhodobacter sp.]|nr:hypothetical protein [Pseudorhodobacter sp.]